MLCNMYEQSPMDFRTVLHQAVTVQGILASTQAVSNYRRVWARDSVITGIAGLIADDAVLIEGLQHSLQSLAAQQSEQGHIPSNVQFSVDGKLEKVSFGGLCGRVDANTWWIIGLGLLSRKKEVNYLEKYRSQVEQCLALLQAWEYNNRGFLYVPQSGNWADEYILAGYTLYDQLLYFWALSLCGEFLEDSSLSDKAARLKKMIQDNFWIEKPAAPDLYHSGAYKRVLEKGSSKYWEACLSPGGYIHKFDLLGNSLAILLGISDLEQSVKVIDFAMQTSVFQQQHLFPSFYPVIEKEDKEWFLLEANYAYEFRNYPFEFQNAGIWPAFNGWFGAAMLKAGKGKEAKALLVNIKAANGKKEQGFYECINGKTGEAHGTKYCTWSAAGELLLASLINVNNFSLFENGK